MTKNWRENRSKPTGLRLFQCSHSWLLAHQIEHCWFLWLKRHCRHPFFISMTIIVSDANLWKIFKCQFCSSYHCLNNLPRFPQWVLKYSSPCGRLNWISSVRTTGKLLNIWMWLRIYYNFPIDKDLKATHYIVFLFRCKWV